MTEPSERPRASARVDGVDVARGLASMIMVQGHAYDGWVDAEGKTTFAYAVTRLFGSLPLPSFLLLSGAAIALRCEAAIERGEPAAQVRWALARRGLEVLAIGYLVNAASALMDGWEGPETFLRADVLPLIGLCIATLAVLGVRGDASGRVSRRALTVAGIVVAILPVLACPVITPWSRGVEGPARYVVGLLADVPEVTRMPFVPLASWAAVGLLLGLGLARANRTERAASGAPTRVLVGMLGGSVAVAFAAATLTGAWVTASGTPLDRAHPAVIANAVDLAARGAIVLATGALVTPHLPQKLRAILVRLGRGSLVAYVFHVPFCYGALGLPVRGQLSMLEATLLVIALEVASYGAVWARDALRARWTNRASEARPTS